MPNKKSKKLQSMDDLRHAEYYNLQPIFDDLYAKSKNGEIFENLMELILSEENIMLAYRNIKNNKGSKTPETDKLTIADIGRMSKEEVVSKVRYYTTGSKHGYRPKPVRRKDIPKPNGSTRPLGIPCIWDRLIQQCIKQILEPICEAKFSENSYGFRPNRCVEHAIAETHRLIQKSHMYYVVEFDIKGFFDNVNHPKLMRQIWTLGIRDKQLLYIIKRILKAPIKMPDGKVLIPDKGTPQGGIISPLLANIVLNELDHWIDNQWINNLPIMNNYSLKTNKAGCPIRSTVYAAMRKTKLKEMYIIRYADDFRIFCRTYEQAKNAKIAITKWLEDRLKLEISQEKTKIVNVKKRYTEFLGFKLKVYIRGKKFTVKSHVKDSQLQRITQTLTGLIKKAAHPRKAKDETEAIRIYNATVLGVQNYYSIATHIAMDFRKVSYAVMAIMASQYHEGKGKRRSLIAKKGNPLTAFEQERYGKCKMLRYTRHGKYPIYPISYVKPHPPISKKRSVCCYTAEGRKGIHDNLKLDKDILIQLMQEKVYDQSSEFSDNRLSLFSAQKGKCAITQRVFQNTSDIHCHHKVPREKGGTDKYSNLMLILEPVHKLVHAKKTETILWYLDILKLTSFQIQKVNKLREILELNPIA
ncbi:group II intron reverse transcriptase/maturase [Allofournierella massiliensis]|uniref:group II intron reverse transcriptase/maturase n=1 Tax=Allofournierella massiliensis TaxID=1650663 RepID=UPI00399F3AC5